MAICVGAVVSGAMFGDNLSMISDTTIAKQSERRGREMKKTSSERTSLSSFLKALVTVAILFFMTRGAEFRMDQNLQYNIWQVVPYLFVLVTALIGINVFVVLISGTVLSVIVGIATGSLPARKSLPQSEAA